MSSRQVIKKLECPNCGAPVEQHMFDAQTLVCGTCGAHIAVGAETAEVIDKGTKRLAKPPVPIEIGQMITLEGTEYFVMGRVHYVGWDQNDSSDKWYWHEWLFGAADGRLLWLSHDEKGFTLYKKMRFREQFDALRDSQLPISDGRSVRVHERYPAQILGAEGELTWRPSTDETLMMVEAAGYGKRYSVQKTAKEMEVYEGTPIEEAEVAKALNDEAWLKRLERKKQWTVTQALIGVVCIAFAAVAFVVGIIANGSGEVVVEQPVQLSNAAPTSFIEVPLDQTGRPAIVSVGSETRLSENTSFDVNVSITSPNEHRDFLFSQSFWHETGVDSDGFWRDTRYNQADMFVPTVTGNHKLELTLASTVGVSDATLNVRVLRNHVFPLWYLLYGGCVGVVGGALLFMAVASGSKKTG